MPKSLSTGVVAYIVKVAENSRWSSPVYLYRNRAEQERESQARIGLTPTITRCRVTHVAAQTVSTDQFGGCTVKRAITGLCLRGRYIYGQTKVGGRLVMVRVPRRLTRYPPRWRVVNERRNP
jgi:hypothetical protein